VIASKARETAAVMPAAEAATDTGFESRDTTYSSLSRIAREITGTRWSGPRFFGLHPPVSPVLPVVDLDAGNV